MSSEQSDREALREVIGQEVRELADAIFDDDSLALPTDADDATESIINRIVSLGFTRPRVVETEAELDALPPRSIVRDASHWVAEAFPVAGRWIRTGESEPWRSDEIALPTTVLFLGGDE